MLPFHRAFNAGGHRGVRTEHDATAERRPVRAVETKRQRESSTHHAQRPGEMESANVGPHRRRRRKQCLHHHQPDHQRRRQFYNLSRRTGHVHDEADAAGHRAPQERAFLHVIPDRPCRHRRHQEFHGLLCPWTGISLPLRGRWREATERDYVLPCNAYGSWQCNSLTTAP